jgi:hypothetical protein
MRREPLNPHAFDEFKHQQESRKWTIEQINSYMADTRQRVDTLIKSTFVLSGGALTISIGLFLRDSAPTLSGTNLVLLRISWALLFYSLAASSSILFLMIVQGYMLGEQWKRQLEKQQLEVEKKWWAQWTVRANWSLGITGFLAFLAGLGFLACVSIQTISQP